MIKCHLSTLMGARKLTLVDVARDTGINRGTITRLYHETATRVDLDVIEALCRYLECEVGDLFELQHEPQEQQAAVQQSSIGKCKPRAVRRLVGYLLLIRGMSLIAHTSIHTRLYKTSRRSSPSAQSAPSTSITASTGSA